MVSGYSFSYFYDVLLVIWEQFAGNSLIFQPGLYFLIENHFSTAIYYEGSLNGRNLLKVVWMSMEIWFLMVSFPVDACDQRGQTIMHTK